MDEGELIRRLDKVTAYGRAISGQRPIVPTVQRVAPDNMRGWDAALIKRVLFVEYLRKTGRLKP